MIKERRTSLQTLVWYCRSGSTTSRMTVGDVDFDLVRGADLLHLTGISPALSASMAEVTFQAVRVARESGVPVSFDLNYRGKLWSRERAGETYRRIIPLVDVVLAGDDEAAIAVGRPTTRWSWPVGWSRSGHVRPSSSSAPGVPWRSRTVVNTPGR